MIPILLVDDQAANLAALEVMLASSGCRLVRAQSADEALLALLREDFAAIVLDVRMPGMDGIELARLIKTRERNRHVPILFITGFLLDDADVLRGYEAGGVDYLTKPIQPAVLRSKIAVFAELFRSRRALARANESLRSEIAERERAEEALRLANQELERRVDERTRALSLAHDELREHATRLHLALDAARMGSWVWDVGAGRVHWTPAPASLPDASPPDFEGSPEELLALVHPDDQPAVDDRFRHALAEASALRLEARFRRPDGSVRWALLAGQVVTGEDDRPLRIAGVDLDITDRRLAEEALRDADRRKDEFLAMLAHELRNPLAPIGYAMRALDLAGPPSAELRRAGAVIDRQLRQLTRLIDDLLDMSRISRGSLEVRKRPVTLQAVLRDALDAVQPLVEERGHRLAARIPTEPIVVHADEARLAQAFLNLLHNSVKYTEPQGRIWLEVEPADDFATVRVRDTGIGIPPEMIDRVFDMFTQVDQRLERSQGGLGVGLTLVRRIVQLHGGCVEARSEGIGRGAELIVRLPVETGLPVPNGAADRANRAGPRRRILIAEDSKDAADTFAMLLSMQGHEVRVAYDGLEAIEAASAFQPGVIVMDIGMPRLNGYDAARRIRAEPWGRDVVLVAVTGWGQPEDKERSREAGFDRHLTKPVDPAALESLLATI